MAKTVLTLAELESFFLDWLAKEAAAGRTKNRTLDYYRTWLNRFTQHAGAARDVAELVALDLERFKKGWHSVQTVQRLFNWGVKVGLLERNPFREVVRPELGERERTLRPDELLRLLRCCRRPLRDLLLAMRLTLGRPQELRAARWCDYNAEACAFILAEFKAKRRRKDKAKYRILPVVPRLARQLFRLRRHNTHINDPIFRNFTGQAWTASALCQAVRRAARRAGLAAAGQENIVAYTLRHTAATAATANGVRDRRLADLLGHTSTQTTARYQHLDIEHLAEAIQQATQRRRRA